MLCRDADERLDVVLKDSFQDETMGVIEIVPVSSYGELMCLFVKKWKN